jgi:hypothetical protein
VQVCRIPPEALKLVLDRAHVLGRKAALNGDLLRGGLRHVRERPLPRDEVNHVGTQPEGDTDQNDGDDSGDVGAEVTGLGAQSP